ncbi:hypothetical protein C1X20_23265 [Pseudomonas sp. FW305-3-2-15-C-LB3]|nr:hypothetical protein C1X22_22710 [Pseudomonas sp. DP16D-L5]PMV60185.1 hypothetical protein C1X20_23265 [Pseudomonas sp. FW305-3-2-15-C-LB3]
MVGIQFAIEPRPTDDFLGQQGHSVIHRVISQRTICNFTKRFLSDLAMLVWLEVIKVITQLRR